MTHNNVCGGDRWLGGGAVVGLVWCGGIGCGSGGVWVEVECIGHESLEERQLGFCLN